MNRFISFEGSEGCGKSTQAARLRAKLKALGHDVIATREPGGTPLGEALRHLLKHAPEGNALAPEAELLLFAAARAQLAREVIGPALAAGKWVIADRYADSSVVYQGDARGLPLEMIHAVNALAMGEARPALTLVLEVDPELAATRMRSRAAEGGGADRFETLGVDFFTRVRAGYQRLAGSEAGRVKLIAADGTPEEVEARVWQEVARAFNL